MRYIALLLLLIAARGWGQQSSWYFDPATGRTVIDGHGSPLSQSDWMPSEYGDPPKKCVDGYKLQRYHQAPFATADEVHDLAFHGTTVPDRSGWEDAGVGPHDGDYRCVKDEPKTAKTCVLNEPHSGDVLITDADDCPNWKAVDTTISHAYCEYLDATDALTCTEPDGKVTIVWLPVGELADKAQNSECASEVCP